MLLHLSVLLPLALQLPSLGLPSLELPVALNAYGDAAQACAAVAMAPNDGAGWRRLGKLLHGSACSGHLT